MTVKDRVVPKLVGADIGCGMFAVNLGRRDIDLAAFAGISANRYRISTSCSLEGEYFGKYIHDLKICQEFANLNRELIAEILLNMRDGAIICSGRK